MGSSASQVNCLPSPAGGGSPAFAKATADGACPPERSVGGWGESATPSRPAGGRSTSPLQGEVKTDRPITFQFVTEGRPLGSRFLHHPILPSSPPGALSIVPS